MTIVHTGNGPIDPGEEAQARTEIDIAHPFQIVEFAPRLDAAGLRRMAKAALAVSAGPAAIGQDDAWATLANALHAAAARDAAGHGAAMSALEARQRADQAEWEQSYPIAAGHYSGPDQGAL